MTLSTPQPPGGDPMVHPTHVMSEWKPFSPFTEEELRVCANCDGLDLRDDEQGTSLTDEALSRPCPGEEMEDER